MVPDPGHTANTYGYGRHSTDVATTHPLKLGRSEVDGHRGPRPLSPALLVEVVLPSKTVCYLDADVRVRCLGAPWVPHDHPPLVVPTVPYHSRSGT